MSLRFNHTRTNVIQLELLEAHNEQGEGLPDTDDERLAFRFVLDFEMC